MKPVKLIGVVAVVMSVILGGALYWAYTINNNIPSEFFFQMLGISAGLLLGSGFAMLLLSKKKPDAFEEAISALTSKASESAGAMDEVRSKRSSDQLPLPACANETSPKTAPDLTFEEEMALRKKQYADQVNVPAKEEPEKIHLPQKSVSLSPPAPAKPEPEKVKVKFEFPFGKKKQNPLKELLDEEERKEDKVTTWKSH